MLRNYFFNHDMCRTAKYLLFEFNRYGACDASKILALYFQPRNVVTSQYPLQQLHLAEVISNGSGITWQPTAFLGPAALRDHAITLQMPFSIKTLPSFCFSNAASLPPQSASHSLTKSPPVPNSPPPRRCGEIRIAKKIGGIPVECSTKP